jgi:hypothetical protein
MPPNFQGCCAHDHDCEEADCSGTWSLNKYVDIQRVSMLPERKKQVDQHQSHVAAPHFDFLFLRYAV